MTVVVLVLDWRPTPVWAGTRQVSMLVRALYEYLAIFHLGTVVQDLLQTSLQLLQKGLTSLVGSFSPLTQGISWDPANRAGLGPANGVVFTFQVRFFVSLDIENIGELLLILLKPQPYKNVSYGLIHSLTEMYAMDRSTAFLKCMLWIDPQPY